jgi:hypothetical protein
MDFIIFKTLTYLLRVGFPAALMLLRFDEEPRPRIQRPTPRSVEPKHNMFVNSCTKTSLDAAQKRRSTGNEQTNSEKEGAKATAAKQPAVPPNRQTRRHFTRNPVMQSCMRKALHIVSNCQLETTFPAPVRGLLASQFKEVRRYQWHKHCVS